ncbi:polysaccharide deacetylase family protein [Aquariibacter albus]|nr:polysaccharide deacetylase family protein [Aquariibacter albus]
MYHRVGVFPRPAAHRALFCDVGRFARQMHFLRWAGIDVVSLDQALVHVAAGQFDRPRVVLTFDDGYQDFADHAWPILKSMGYPASVFLVSRQVGGPARWLGSDLPAANLMDRATLRRLDAEGVDFGSHTQNHRRLSTLSDTQMRGEILNSKHELEDMLGHDIRHFCYPYGDYTESARACVQTAGYHSGLTCIRGAANLATNVHELPRKAISHGDNLFGFAWKILFKHARKGRGAIVKAEAAAE